MKKIVSVIGAVVLATTLGACSLNQPEMPEVPEGEPIPGAHVIERYDVSHSGTSIMNEYVVELHDGIEVRCLTWKSGYGGGTTCDWGALSNMSTTLEK